MRILLFTALLAISVAGHAIAQGYEYQASGLEFEPTVPARAGETVQGLLKMDNGFTALGDVKIADVYYDDLFAYWVGLFDGKYYLYDQYSGYWRATPVAYQHAKLDFQGEIVEGWVRNFGNWTDRDHFFGRDGILYKRINILRNRTRDTSSRRRVVYTYFVNTATGERSDGTGRAYTIIGDEDVAIELVEQAEQDGEQQLEAVSSDNPAYEDWRANGHEVPEMLGIPGEIDTENGSVMDLIEEEIGPLTVDEDTAAGPDTERDSE